MVKSLQKCLIMLMSAVIAFTCLFAFEAALPQYALTAYAASISAPSVKAENTSPTSVNLKWKKVKGAKKYVVYRSTKKNKGFKAVKTIKKSSTVSYTDKKLKAGSTYYYKVAAVNGKSKKSSKAVKIKAIPSAVKGIDGESKTCSTVTVVFNKQSGVSGYDVQYSATENGKYKTVSLQKGTSFNHTIGEGAIGFYKVRAYITVKGKKIYGGFSDIIGIEAYSHSYNQSVVEPTCIAGGYTLYTCSVCSSSYTTNPTPVTSHKFGSYIIDKDATCATTGSKHKTCSVCGFKQYKSIEATGEHGYNEYVVTANPTCTESGIETSSCRFCGKERTRIVQPTGHSYGGYVVTTPATCIEEGVESAKCNACGDTITRSTARVDHSYGEYVVTTPATCTTDGTQTASCRWCAITVTKTIDKTGHSYGEFVVATPSTCTTDGVEEARCSNCDSTITRDIPATGHSYGEYVVTTPATCTSNGIETAHCADCEKTITREIPAIEHSYTMTNYAASCTEQGYDEFTCSVCGNTYKSNYTDALGHSYGDYAVVTPASCAADGVESAKCINCDATISRDIPAIGHSYSEYTVTTPASCTTDGVETAYCTTCEKTITREIPAIEHSYTMTNYAASCTEQGYDEFTCSVCGNTYKSNYTDALGHSYGEYAVTTPATDTENGVEIATCASCGATKTRPIAAIGHSYGEYVVTTPATCTANGIETAHCADCEKTITREIPAIEHSYTMTNYAASCTEQGYDEFTCSVCGNTYKSNYTDALGHSYGEYAVTTPATDTENGVETATCASCGATKTRPIAAIGHSYGEYVVTTPATCTANGIETAYCADCEKTITREIPAIEHSYTMTNYAASCTEQGYDEYTCSDCGNSYRCNYTNALGHSYGDYAVVTPASCAADGVESAKCVNCEATISRDIPAIGHSYGEYVVTTPVACTTDGVETATCASCGTTITRSIAAIGHNPQNVKNEKGYIENKCINCNELYSTDTTCYIDLTSRTVSVPSVASFTVSLSGNDKLDLNYDGVSNYEITGTAENLSIDVNATADCEVKLAGVTITNTDLDIINIKDKSPNEADEAAAAGSVALDVIPVVAISAKVDTVNTLTTKAGELVKGGKIIDSDCRLELKGRGTINMDTTATAVSSMDPTDPNYPASTAIRNSEKIYIKNLTLDIKSANRGIDTKKDFKDAEGNVYDTEFYNIELSGNAKITITSTDDGIRCKNFDSNYLAVDEVDSTVTINAGGDGIQLEGKSTNRLASMILHSGTFNINGTKSIINNKSMKVPVADGTATANFATIPPSMA